MCDDDMGDLDYPRESYSDESRLLASERYEYEQDYTRTEILAMHYVDSYVVVRPTIMRILPSVPF